MCPAEQQSNDLRVEVWVRCRQCPHVRVRVLLPAVPPIVPIDAVHDAVELELALERLIRLDIQGMPIMRRWYVGNRRGKRLSPTAQAFRQFVLDEGARQAVA